MLFVADPKAHPALANLSPAALSAWFAAVHRCDLFHTDILERSDVGGAHEEIVDEWEHAGLASLLPLGFVRMVQRESLWRLDRFDELQAAPGPSRVLPVRR